MSQLLMFIYINSNLIRKNTWQKKEKFYAKKENKKKKK